MISHESKKNSLISVIVPVYNVERYLPKCVETILHQTYKNLEIILVNDGSTDNSPFILHEYELKDPRIQVIHQNNMGLSGARNTGIQHAKGEYILFIDSDDYIKPEMAELLMANMLQYNSDISICGYYRVDEEGTILTEDSGYQNLKDIKPVYQGKELFRKNLLGTLYNMAWNKLYKKALFVANNIQYPLGLYHEDIATTFKLFWYCNKISILNTPCYYWLVRESSISNTFRQKHIEDYISILEINEHFLKEHFMARDYTFLFKKRCHHIMSVVLSKIYKHEQKNELLVHLNNEIKSADVDMVDLRRVARNEETVIKMKIVLNKIRNYPIPKTNITMNSLKETLKRILLRILLIDTHTRPYKEKFKTGRLQLLFETLTYKLASRNIGITRTTKNIIRHRNICKGKRAFLIGNGPSLNLLDLTKLKNEITIGVNSIYLNKDKMGFLPTHYIVEDIYVAEDRKDEINELIGPQKWFGNYLRYCFKEIQNETINWLNVRFNYSNYLDFPHFSTNIARQAWVGGTVSYIGLQLAYYLGVEELYLIGFDHHYVIPSDVIAEGLSLTSVSDDPNHFHPDYFGKGYRWHDPNVERMEKGYIKARKFFEKENRKIFNATAGGKLEVFKRVDYNTLF